MSPTAADRSQSGRGRTGLPGGPPGGASARDESSPAIGGLEQRSPTASQGPSPAARAGNRCAGKGPGTRTRSAAEPGDVEAVISQHHQIPRSSAGHEPHPATEPGPRAPPRTTRRPTVSPGQPGVACGSMARCAGSRSRRTSDWNRLPPSPERSARPGHQHQRAIIGGGEKPGRPASGARRPERRGAGANPGKNAVHRQPERRPRRRHDRRRRGPGFSAGPAPRRRRSRAARPRGDSSASSCRESVGTSCSSKVRSRTRPLPAPLAATGCAPAARRQPGKQPPVSR